jgi:hypothetical protein
MDTTITFNEVAALVANLPSLTRLPNFTNLCALQCHIQYSLQRLSRPQSKILGWVGVIMECHMYALLRTLPFRLPMDPGSLAIYYPPPVPILDIHRAPVINIAGQPTFVVPPTIDCMEQATIDACFNHARNY